MSGCAGGAFDASSSSRVSTYSLGSFAGGETFAALTFWRFGGNCRSRMLSWLACSRTEPAPTRFESEPPSNWLLLRLSFRKLRSSRGPDPSMTTFWRFHGPTSEDLLVAPPCSCLVTGRPPLAAPRFQVGRLPPSCEEVVLRFWVWVCGLSMGVVADGRNLFAGK